MAPHDAHAVHGRCDPGGEHRGDDDEQQDAAVLGRKGPHDGAQKSTSNFPLPISWAKPASLSVTGWPSPSPSPSPPAGTGSSLLHFPQTAFAPLPSCSGTRLGWPHEGQVM